MLRPSARNALRIAPTSIASSHWPKGRECSNPQAGEVLSHLRDRPAAPRGSPSACWHAFNAFARLMRGRPAPTNSPSPVLWSAWRQEECRKTVLAIFQQYTSPVQTVRPAWPCRFRLHFEPPGSTPRVPRESPRVPPLRITSLRPCPRPLMCCASLCASGRIFASPAGLSLLPAPRATPILPTVKSTRCVLRV